jgi:hypothetical protein
MPSVVECGQVFYRVLPILTSDGLVGSVVVAGHGYVVWRRVSLGEDLPARVGVEMSGRHVETRSLGGAVRVPEDGPEDQRPDTENRREDGETQTRHNRLIRNIPVKWRDNPRCWCER